MALSMSHNLLQALVFVFIAITDVVAINAEIRRQHALDPRGISRDNEHTLATISAHEMPTVSPSDSVLITPSGKQLLRREETGQHKPDCTEEDMQDPNRDCVEGAEAAEGKAMLKEEEGLSTSLVDDDDESYWQKVSAGDVKAICVNNGYIYAVALDKLAVISGGIFRQPLSTLGPYSNWVLHGYGQMNSIAIWNSPTGDIMYGVANNTWLYKQYIDAMPTKGMWDLASVFNLDAIAIDGDKIYGVTPYRPEEDRPVLYYFHLNGMVFNVGWMRCIEGNVKTLSVMNGMIYGLFRNKQLYTHDQNSRTSLEAANQDWDVMDLKIDRKHDIAVWGDSMYMVGEDKKVYRQPLKIKKEWTIAAKGPMRSLAVDSNENTIYGLAPDGKVYKQALGPLSDLTNWNQASGGNIKIHHSIAIEGDIIYGIGMDKQVWKQKLSTMTLDSDWWQCSIGYVLQIAVDEGKMYAIGEDTKVYWQSTKHMNILTAWNLASKGGVVALAIRRDMIYGVIGDSDATRELREQRISDMKADIDEEPGTEWRICDMQDKTSPKYYSIMVHNDVMYACGHDQNVYSKSIHEYVKYPHHLLGRGGTHYQALRWNLTDISGTSRIPVVTMPPPATNAPHTPSTTTEQLVVGPSTGSTTTKKPEDVGIQEHFIDRYQDVPKPYQGAEPVKTSKYESDQPLIFQGRAWQSSHVAGFVALAAHSFILMLELTSLM